MIEGVCPFLATHSLFLKFSTGTDELEPTLRRRPSVCPTSCDETNCTKRPINSSGNTICLARVSLGPAWTIYQLRISSITLWYQLIWLSIISPLRGSEILGPLAFAMSEGL